MVKQAPPTQPERAMPRSSRSTASKSPKMNGHGPGNITTLLLNDG